MLGAGQRRSSARLVGARALLWAQLIGLALVAVAAPLVDEPVPLPHAVELAWLGGAGAAALMAYLCMFHAFEHGR
jgi:hypothetical protein